MTPEEFWDALVVEIARRVATEIQSMPRTRASNLDDYRQTDGKGQAGIRPLAVGINEAANLLCVSSYTLRRNIERGEIRVVRVGRRVLIEPREIARLIEKGRTQPNAATENWEGQ